MKGECKVKNTTEVSQEFQEHVHFMARHIALFQNLCHFGSWIDFFFWFYGFLNFPGAGLLEIDGRGNDKVMNDFAIFLGLPSCKRIPTPLLTRPISLGQGHFLLDPISSESVKQGFAYPVLFATACLCCIEEIA